MTKTIRLTLEMTETQAKQLRNLVQNHLIVGDATEELTELRRDIFDALQGALGVHRIDTGTEF